MRFLYAGRLPIRKRSKRLVASVAIVPGRQQFEHNPAGPDLCTTGAFPALGFALSLRLKTARKEDSYAKAIGESVDPTASYPGTDQVSAASIRVPRKLCSAIRRRDLSRPTRRRFPP